jgi:hypothetical protein
MEPDPYGRFWDQLDEVRRQNPGMLVGVWPDGASRGTGVAPQFVYEDGKVLCRAEHLPLVRSRLGNSYVRDEDTGTGLSLISLADGLNVPAQVRIANIPRDDEAPGGPAGPVATPNHIVSITPVNMCPADEPVPVAVDAAPWPPALTDAAIGAGVTILVVDTGLIDGYLTGHPWLSGVRAPSPDAVAGNGGDGGVFRGQSTEDGVIKEYASHGTFVAGVIGAAAPGTEIRLSNALQHAGAIDETQLGRILLSVLGTGEWPHIISLSAGSPTMDGMPLLGLEPFLAALAAHPQTVLIAAAGNDARRDDQEPAGQTPPYHFWPAAYAPVNPGIISVGALARRHDGRACFSNYGTSVTVWARGEEHINAFLSGVYEYRNGTDPVCHNYPADPLYAPCSCVTSLPWHAHALFQGMARWSGTSFAAPLVAAMVASYMSETGNRTDARAAAHELIAARAEDLVDTVARQVDGVNSPALRAFR